MPYTIDGALADPDVTVIIRNEDLGEFVVTIGELETPVTITVRRLPHVEQFEFRTSHVMHTPSQIAPYRTSRDFEDNYAHALDRAISGLTEYYRGGVTAGHTPRLRTH